MMNPQLYNSLSNWRVLVIGDVMLDDYTFCETNHSKLIPSECKNKRAYRATNLNITPGGAANVAANLRALGAATSLVGVAGRDGYDSALRLKCEQLGILTSLIIDRTRPTTVKRRIYVDNEYFFRIDNEDSNPLSPMVAKRVIQEINSKAYDIDTIVLSDYNKGFFTPEVAREIISTANNFDIPVIVDCKPNNNKLFRGVDLTIPNLIEAVALYPSFKVKNLRESMDELYKIVGSKHLAVTLGKDGIASLSNEGEFNWIKGLDVEVSDTVGAGDTVRAGVALGYALQLPLEHTLELANQLGALVVQKVGTSFVTSEELATALGAPIIQWANERSQARNSGELKIAN